MVVILAQILIVIGERDKFIKPTSGELNVENYLSKILLNVPKDQGNKFTLQWSGEGSFSTSCFSSNTVSNAEINTGYFIATLDESSFKFFPSPISTKDSNNTTKAFLTRKENNCNLILKANQQDFQNTSIWGRLRNKDEVSLIYNIVLKTPRKMSVEFGYSTIDSILNKILVGGPEVDPIIDKNYNLSGSKTQIELKRNQIVVMYLLGLEPNQLFDLLKETKDRYYFSFTDLESEVKKTTEAAKSSQNLKDKLLHYNKLRDFYKNKFKGNSKFGFDNSDEFYYFVTDPIPLTIRLSIF